MDGEEEAGTSGVEFVQELKDTADGYAYMYRKLIRLVPGKPQMVIEHSLKNTGTKQIQSTVYNHNFFVLDGEGPTQDLSITVPFAIESPRPPTPGLLEVRGNQLVYLKTLVNEDRAIWATIRGFGDTAKDYDIRVENKRIGGLISRDRRSPPFQHCGMVHPYCKRGGTVHLHVDRARERIYLESELRVLHAAQAMSPKSFPKTRALVLLASLVALD